MKSKLIGRAYNKTDSVLLCGIIVLVAFGVLMMYSAGRYSAKLYYNNEFYYVYKQLIGAVVGLAVMGVLAFTDYHKLIRLRFLILFASYLLLVLVFVPGIGVENYGAKRWINLPFFTIQASEVAKFGFIVFAAASLAKNKDKTSTVKGILPVLAVGISMCVLIMLEPNMSITMCLALLMFAMLFIGGARIKHFVMMLVPLVVAVPVLIFIEPYRLNRLLAFLDPWNSPLGEGYQLIQSFYALASGGLFGVGLFNSRQKYLFLPFSESDFIFAVIGEEFGFLGCVAVLVVYIAVICRIVKIALGSADRFGCYLSSGIAALLAIQVLINVAVVSGAIPPTGLPLPFISSGSSSLIVYCAAIGVVFSVERFSHKSVKCLISKYGYCCDHRNKRIRNKK